MPVATNVKPVMIPALCSHLCQFSLSIPLYTILTQISIPVIVITEYIMAIKAIIYQPLVPAKRKYPSISIHGDRNIATTKAKTIAAFDFLSICAFST